MAETKVYQVELSDGRVVNFESDTPPSEADIVQIEKIQAQRDKPTERGTLESVLSGAGMGAAPSAAFLATMGGVGRATAGLNPLIRVPASLLAGMGAAAATGFGQRKALEKLSPETLKATEEMAAQHPWATAAGQALTSGFKIGAPEETLGKEILARLTPAALGAGIATGSELMQTSGTPEWFAEGAAGRISEAALINALLNKETAYGKKMMNLGAGAKPTSITDNLGNVKAGEPLPSATAKAAEMATSPAKPGSARGEFWASGPKSEEWYRGNRETTAMLEETPGPLEFGDLPLDAQTGNHAIVQHSKLTPEEIRAIRMAEAKKAFDIQAIAERRNELEQAPYPDGTVLPAEGTLLAEQLKKQLASEQGAAKEDAWAKQVTELTRVKRAQEAQARAKSIAEREAELAREIEGFQPVELKEPMDFEGAPPRSPEVQLAEDRAFKADVKTTIDNLKAEGVDIDRGTAIELAKLKSNPARFNYERQRLIDSTKATKAEIPKKGPMKSLSEVESSAFPPRIDAEALAGDVAGAPPAIGGPGYVPNIPTPKAPEVPVKPVLSQSEAPAVPTPPPTAKEAVKGKETPPEAIAIDNKQALELIQKTDARKRSSELVRRDTKFNNFTSMGDYVSALNRLNELLGIKERWSSKPEPAPAAGTDPVSERISTLKKERDQLEKEIDSWENIYFGSFKKYGNTIPTESETEAGWKLMEGRRTRMDEIDMEIYRLKNPPAKPETKSTFAPMAMESYSDEVKNMTTQKAVSTARKLLGEDTFRKAVSDRVAWFEQNQPLVDTSTEASKAGIVEQVAREIVTANKKEPSSGTKTESEVIDDIKRRLAESAESAKATVAKAEALGPEISAKLKELFLKAAELSRSWQDMTNHPLDYPPAQRAAKKRESTAAFKAAEKLAKSHGFDTKEVYDLYGNGLSEADDIQQAIVRGAEEQAKKARAKEEAFSKFPQPVKDAIKRRNIEPDGRLISGSKGMDATPENVNSVVARIEADIRAREAHIGILERAKARNPNASADKVRSFLHADTHITSFDEGIRAIRDSIEGSRQYVNDVKAAGDHYLSQHPEVKPVELTPVEIHPSDQFYIDKWLGVEAKDIASQPKPETGKKLGADAWRAGLRRRAAASTEAKPASKPLSDILSPAKTEPEVQDAIGAIRERISASGEPVSYESVKNKVTPKEWRALIDEARESQLQNVEDSVREGTWTEQQAQAQRNAINERFDKVISDYDKSVVSARAAKQEAAYPVEFGVDVFGENVRAYRKVDAAGEPWFINVRGTEIQLPVTNRDKPTVRKEATKAASAFILEDNAVKANAAAERGEIDPKTGLRKGIVEIDQKATKEQEAAFDDIPDTSESPHSIAWQEIDSLEANLEPKAKLVKRAKELADEGLIDRKDLEEIQRIAKDRDMGTEDVAGEIKSAIEYAKESAAKPEQDTPIRESEIGQDIPQPEGDVSEPIAEPQSIEPGVVKEPTPASASSQPASKPAYPLGIKDGKMVDAKGRAVVKKGSDYVLGIKPNYGSFARSTGAGLGFAAGYATGDTEDEKLRNAFIGAGIGFGGVAAAKALANAKKVTDLSKPYSDAIASGRTPTEKEVSDRLMSSAIASGRTPPPRQVAAHVAHAPLGYQPGLTDIADAYPWVKNIPLGQFVSDVIGGFSRMAKFAIGTVSSNLRERLPEAAGMLEDRSYKLGKLIHEHHERIRPFGEAVRNSLKPEEIEQLNANLLSGNFDDARQLLGSKPNGRDILASFDEAVSAMKDMRQRAVDLGLEVGQVDNYWPRVLVDRRGLLRELGSEASNRFDDMVSRAIKANNGESLNEEQMSNLMARFITQARGVGGKPGFLKSRTIGQIDTILAKYYEPFDVAAKSYIDKMASYQINQEFFGKIRPTFSDTETIGGSIGDALLKARAEKRISSDDLERISEVLRRYFRADYRQRNEFNKVANAFRTVQTFGMLADIGTAAVQFADIFTILNQYGPKGIAAYFRTKGKRIELSDINIFEGHNQDLADLSRAYQNRSVLAKGVRAAYEAPLKYLLGGADIVNKRGMVNAAQKWWSGIAKDVNSSEFKRLDAYYREMYPERWPEMLKDIQSDAFASGDPKKLTENMKFFLRNEIVRHQPIDLHHRAEGYSAAGPFGKLAYTLRSYSIAQINGLRRDVYEEFKRGNTKIAISKLGMYLALVGAGQQLFRAGLDVAQGKGTEDIDEYATQGALQLAMLPRYSFFRLRDQGPFVAGMELLVPGASITNDAYKDIRSIQKYVFDQRDKAGFSTIPDVESLGKELESTRYLPVLGKELYNWFGKGATRLEKQAEDEARGKKKESTAETMWQLVVPNDIKSIKH